MFAPGDLCLLIDGKGRRYLVRLEPGRQFHSHLGPVDHDEILGGPDGVEVTSSRGQRMVAFRPRMVDYTLKMRRGAQVVYPKDIGPILVEGDIGPGSKVLEAGTGSGALTIALLRAVGSEGRVVSYEQREDHAEHARGAIERFFGELPAHLELRVGPVEEGLSAEFDRVVLDLPEPWHAVAAGADKLRSGTIFVAYVPTIPQVQTTVEAMRASGAYTMIDAFEVLHRGWNVEGRSVRPEHRMVGHTGFLVVARRFGSS